MPDTVVQQATEQSLESIKRAAVELVRAAAQRRELGPFDLYGLTEQQPDSRHVLLSEFSKLLESSSARPLLTGLEWDGLMRGLGISAEKLMRRAEEIAGEEFELTLDCRSLSAFFEAASNQVLAVRNDHLSSDEPLSAHLPALPQAVPPAA